MADIKNVITLGIGVVPGNIRYFVLMGLDVNPLVAAPVPLTVRPRETALTVDERSVSLTLRPREMSLTVEDIR